VRALSEQRLLPLASDVDAAFVALLAAHVPLVHDAVLAVRLFRRPLRQAAAPLQCAGAARRAAQRLAAQRDRVAHAHPGQLRARLLCCGTTRATFSLTASCLPTAGAFLAQGRAHTRSRSGLSSNYSSDAAEALASSGSSDDGGDLLARSSTGGTPSTSGTRSSRPPLS
jgi:hypothetical protein